VPQEISRYFSDLLRDPRVVGHFLIGGAGGEATGASSSTRTAGGSARSGATARRSRRSRSGRRVLRPDHNGATRTGEVAWRTDAQTRRAGFSSN